MPENNIKNNTPSSSNVGSPAATVSTQVPGVDMTQVIASPPHLVKENSSKVDIKFRNSDRWK